MKDLKHAFQQIKNISQKDFEKCYDTVVEAFLEDYDPSLNIAGYDIDDLCIALTIELSPKLKKVKAVVLGDKKIFPHAEYGWDKGEAINTYTFNLKKLSKNDIASGPIAHIVMLQKDSYPGLAFHENHNENIWEIHIFS